MFRNRQSLADFFEAMHSNAIPCAVIQAPHPCSTLPIMDNGPLRNAQEQRQAIGEATKLKSIKYTQLPPISSFICRDPRDAMIRLIFAVSLLLLGFASSIRELLNSNYFIAASVMMIAMVAAIGVLLSQKMIVSYVTASFCIFISAAAIYHDHRAFNTDLMQAQSAAAVYLVTARPAYGCDYQETSRLQSSALQACAMGPYDDLGSATQAFGGAMYFGPVSGTILGGRDALIGGAAAPQTCEKAVKQLHSHCQGAMDGFDRKLLSFLLEAADR